MRTMPVSPEALQDRAADAADFMRLFSTPSRLMLLCHIAQRERSVGEIQADLEFKQPALSQQLAELRQAGVVKTRRSSRQIYYSLADDRVIMVMEMLMRMFCASEGDRDAAGDAAIDGDIDSITDGKEPAAGRDRTGLGKPAPDFGGEMAFWARLDTGK
ncbi:helix-turn-helix transcriptional regulator [Rhizobium sp. SSA_523]|uniref:ArsR/SmtB family transcription factor n=1 Tax=Rhizobium sp. SSA_523 TaxID=2952477 RepID=UPI00209064D3|nr:metalloregulator ArsR/SmtB family transcription factor [Rhizobium sp. SSA_523]MCO5734739.1 metalloregulator ArsR/SmtB family transcription factor [Rhizobium sp. SSA_523]WKC22979.1 metalloregulator ArsR/SmtB family transcription factor [Rhizobium sp. SSA_523]